jgi:membrane fusion protein (multidrug efflux system)
MPAPIMKLTFILLAVLFLAPALRAAEEEEKPPTEVAVQTGKVTRATLRRFVTGYGAMEPEPAASAKLAPAVAGIIAEVKGVEGQQVKKGDVLFRLDSRAVDAAAAKAELAIGFAEKNSERQKKLIAAEGTSEKQVLEAEQALAQAKTELATAKVQQSLLTGVAPLNGTLVHFTARIGEPADAATALAEIIDLDHLVAAIRIPRAEASGIKVGQKASLQSSQDGKPVDGAVVFISAQVDAATDTVLVRVSSPKGSGLRPGEFIVARIVSEERKDRLTVPSASVYKDPEDGTVIALVEGELATRKAVKTGLRDGALVEVEGEGLKEGQTVVTVGAYGLPKETKVRVPGAETK